MLLLEIGLLGPPLIRCQNRELSLAARKSAALLYYLAAHPGRPLNRSQLAALLWEEHSEAEERNNLSTALSRLRHSLATLPRFPIVSVGDNVLWQTGPEVQTDLDRFEELTRLSGDADDIHRLEAVVALWRGPFLDGFEIRDNVAYEEWLRQEREHWQQRVLASYRELIEREQRRDRVDPAIAHARRALSIDALQEQLHQTLMRLYFQQGDRASALTQFQTCERVLRDALGVGPTNETRSLRDAIAAGRAIRSPSRASVAVVAERAEAVPIVLSRRRQYRLVGREAELARLSGQLAAPPDQGSRLFLVQGEAGIGKTRLVEELLAQVADPPTERSRETEALGSPQWTVLIGHSYPDAEGLPYHPIVEALRSRLALLAVDTLPVADVWLAEVNRLLPEIGVQRPHLPAPARLDPPQERRRLYEGVAQLLAALGHICHRAPMASR